ncbi:MAG: hypothetical protein IJN43_11290 [Ruminococcus sp.]|nr:hypothetical protein [Ruminococcus sp.]
MRVVKYLTLAVLLAAVLILSAESRLLYSMNFALSPLQLYYDLELSENDLPLLSELAEEQNMLLCIADHNMADTQRLTIYANADESVLLEHLHVHCGEFRSLFWKTPVQIRLFPLVCADTADEAVRVYVFGENRIALERELEKHFTIVSGNVMMQDNAVSIIFVGYLAWGLLILFAFFLSIFDAQAKKRSSFVRILNGASPLKLVGCHIMTEFLILIPLIFIVICITNCYSTVIIELQLLICISILLFACALPYAVLSSISYKIITQERIVTAKLLNFGYVYKTILLSLTIIVFGLTASIGTTFIQNLKVLHYAENYKNHSFVRIETSEINLLEADEIEEYVKYQELTNLRIEEIYQQYYDSHNALIIEPILQDTETISMIYCNENAVDYINDLFGEYRDELNDRQAVLFLPESIEQKEQYLHSSELLLQQYAGEKWHPEIHIISYTGRKNGFCFMPSEDTMLKIVTDPVVLYCAAAPKEIGALITETKKIPIQGLAFRVDETMLEKLESRRDILFEITPINTAIQKNADISKRLCVALAMICAVFIALNLFASSFLIRMEYRLRAKEYCIKTVLGYTMMQKFGSFLLLSALSILISGAAVTLLQKQLAVSPILILGICVGIFLADSATVMLYAVRTERGSIVRCLKGGAL